MPYTFFSLHSFYSWLFSSLFVLLLLLLLSLFYRTKIVFFFFSSYAMEIDVFFLYSLPLASRLRTYIVVVCARTHRFNVVQRNCAFLLSQEILPSSWKTIADTLRMCFFSSLCVVFIFVLSFSFYVFEFDIFRHNCFMCRCSFFFSLRFLSCALWFFMLYFLFTKIILFYFFFIWNTLFLLLLSFFICDWPFIPIGVSI